MKYGTVAADLATGEEVVMTTGSIIDAARASSAIPVLFHAVHHEDRWLVDGALANPAPVSLARELGADVAIGSAQRFGVPMGYGGPHAAFFATHDTFKRAMPGTCQGTPKSTEDREPGRA